MTEIETRLNECLEALIEGRWDLDECLRRNPEHAAGLRPMLLAAIATSQTYDTAPSPQFASASRERFLIATGQRLQETMDVEPSPAFFAGARVRFLMRAQKLRLGERARAPRRAIPLFGTPFRALATGMAAIVVFLGFSTYTVASASAALPGDWQYGVKLKTEELRLALAFNDDSKRDVRLDIAAERVHEIEVLAARGKIIGPGVLDRLVEQTKPLVDDVQSGDWDTGDAARLQEITSKQRQVLVEADAQDQVAPDAGSQLLEAEAVSKSGVEATTQVLFADPDRAPVVVTPGVPLTSTPTDVPPTIGALPTNTPSPETTPEASATPGATEAVPTAVSIPSNGDDITIGANPAAIDGGVKFYALKAGRLQLLVPGAESGWYLDNTQDETAPTLLRYERIDHTGTLVVSKLTGDLYWTVEHNGSLDTVFMRITSNGGVLVVDPDIISAAYGDAANIPLVVLESIVLLPEPTPVPEATNTPKPAPTGTPAAAP